jgi:hypothetical protein
MRLRGGQNVFSSGARTYSSVLFEKSHKNSSTALSHHEFSLSGGTSDDRIGLIEECNENVEEYFLWSVTFS